MPPTGFSRWGAFCFSFLGPLRLWLPIVVANSFPSADECVIGSVRNSGCVFFKNRPTNQKQNWDSFKCLETNATRFSLFGSSAFYQHLPHLSTMCTTGGSFIHGLLGFCWVCSVVPMSSPRASLVLVQKYERVYVKSAAVVPPVGLPIWRPLPPICHRAAARPRIYCADYGLNI